MSMQRTLKTSVNFEGMGLHSGNVVHMEIRPAAANTGIVFQRIDLPNKPYIKASAENVFNCNLATSIGSPDCFVTTVEHLMSAFYGFGVDNAIVTIDSPEVPILDGSAAPFLVLLDEAGIQELSVARKVFHVTQTVEVVDANNPQRFIRVEPSSTPLVTYLIDFANSQTIGLQQHTMSLTGEAFCEEAAFARTFCLAEEVEFMRSRGLAKGGSLANAIVVSKDGVLNTSGLRDAQEFVRHKILDCMGDLALLGMPLIGHVIANKAGHDLHTQLVQKLALQAAEHNVFIPSAAKELDLIGAILKYPVSLADVRRNLASGLVVG